jgi:hypothetical protein
VSRFAPSIALAGALLLGACAVSPPSSPSVVGLPPAGKDLSQFHQDDSACRAYASQQIAGATDAGYTLQVRYDIAYTQCMYSKGNTVRPLTQVSGYALASATYEPYPYYGYYGPLFGTAVVGYSSGCCRYYPHGYWGGFHHGWGGGSQHAWGGARGGWAHSSGGAHGGGSRS